MTLGIFTVIKPSLGSSPLEAPSATDSFTKSLLPISFGVSSVTLGLSAVLTLFWLFSCIESEDTVFSASLFSSNSSELFTSFVTFWG